MVNKLLKLFTSLKLTVACLGLALVLVFLGTLAQVELGLYTVQDKYFQSFLVFWTPKGTDWKIPVLPGGYLLGTILLINLIAAHAKRFQWTTKKIGIFLIHGGLILLLLGQFFTELFQIESSMRIEEGEIKTYSESIHHNELAIIETTSQESNKVVAIPESFLANKAEMSHPELPFRLRIKDYFPNSEPGLGRPSGTSAETLSATRGTGQGMYAVRKPVTYKMDDRNIPSALVEVATADGASDTWLVSNWLSEKSLITLVAKQFGARWRQLAAAPQEIKWGDRAYQIALRPVRYYKPYTIQLLDFTHDRYKGTDVPKNYSSRIQLRNAQTAEDRQILIYMNNPLRYGGETYYQGSFEPGDTTSILHVVRNPAWLTPYVSCVLVAAGLLTQFLMHLFEFGKKRSVASAKGASPPAARRMPKESELEPAGATAALGRSGKRAEKGKHI